MPDECPCKEILAAVARLEGDFHGHARLDDERETNRQRAQQQLTATIEGWRAELAEMRALIADNHDPPASRMNRRADE